MPENEKPPAMRVDIYFFALKSDIAFFRSDKKAFKEYDKYGNLTVNKDFNGNTIAYGYDDLTGALKSLSAQNQGENSDNVCKYKNGLLVKTEHDGVEYNYAYDHKSRIVGYEKVKGDKKLSKMYNYLQRGERTSNLISCETFGENGVAKDKLSYSYDGNGNVIEVRENGELINRYEYDSLNRLVREDNRKLNKSYFFTYDNAGNITKREESALTLGLADTVVKTVVGKKMICTSKVFNFWGAYQNHL